MSLAATAGVALVASLGLAPGVVEDWRKLPASAAAPGASVSVGGHGQGRLEGSERLPGDEPWLGVLRSSRRRGYDHGHSRMVRALVRTARRAGPSVWPPRRLWVGNVAAAVGGAIAPSRSHRTGLDADLVLPALDAHGAPAAPQMAAVRVPGEQGEGPLLDVAAAWAMVEALVDDPEAEPLWLFVSEPIAEALVEHAVLEHRPPHLVARALWLLHQPSDSLPHDDHLHLRLACSAGDRLAGCRDYGPAWPWLERGRKELRDLVVTGLVAALTRGDGLLDALERADRARELGAAPFALLLLNDPERRVRDAAAALLARVAAGQLLGMVLATSAKPPWPHSEELYAARKWGGALAGLAATKRLRESGGCRKGKSSVLRGWLAVLELEPEDEAAEALAACATKGPRVLRQRALHALARVAGRSVPERSTRAAAARLAAAVEQAPAERVDRLAAAYLPPGVPATARAAQRHLRGHLRGDGPDAMNARELFELLRGDRRRTNLMSPSRRRRVWRNRLSAGVAPPTAGEGAPSGGGAR